MNDAPLPPTVPEIEAIVLRRRRARFRVGTGIAGVALLGGVMVATRQWSDSSLVTEPATSATTTRSPDTVEPNPIPCAVPTPSTVVGDVPLFVADGIDRYVAAIGVPTFDEMMGIAEEWGVSFGEAKAVVGYGAAEGMTDFGSRTDDELIGRWDALGKDRQQVAEIAADWNVAPVTLKMLDVLAVGPVVEALADC